MNYKLHKYNYKYESIKKDRILIGHIV